MTVDKMTVDKMTVDKMTRCGLLNERDILFLNQTLGINNGRLLSVNVK
jgi:hypothetical protein